MKMYKSITEALEIYKNISVMKQFTIIDDVTGNSKTGDKFELVSWMNALDILRKGDTSTRPIDSNDVEGWAICEKSADDFCKSDI